MHYLRQAIVAGGGGEIKGGRSTKPVAAKFWKVYLASSKS